MVRRLSGPDAFFLFTEGPSWPMHTGGLVVLDRSNVPDFNVETIRDLIAKRIHKVPIFTMKLKEVPLGLDRPLLVDDPDFNVEFHVHRIAVPSPGGPKELGDLVGQLHQTPLDRRRPLWEMWFIEGLPDNQVAMFLKTHHALVDGVSGAGLAEILCDLEPNPPAVDEPGPTPRPIDRAPSDVELVVRGAMAALSSPWRTAGWFTHWSRRMVSSLRITRSRGGRTALDVAPRAPWNGVIGPLRGFAYNSVALDDVKALRAHFDVKVNDIVLALAAGAVRGYLLMHDALPDSPMVASVPMSMRTGGDIEVGNQIINLYASLETHIDDPVDRLRSIAKGMEALKEIGNALKAKEIRHLSEAVVPGLANLGWRAYQAAQLEARTPLPTNLIVSNVPGPPIPLYSAGARILRLHPVPPIIVAQGLNITVMSYLDSIDFGFCVDRDLVPDVWTIADGVPAALEELKHAAGISTPKPTPKPKPVAKKTTAPRAKTKANATK